MSQARTLNTWETLAELELTIEDYALEPLTASVSSNFERKTTVIRLRGGTLGGTGGTLAGTGEEGIGEDVTYDAVDHEILQAAGPQLPLAGRFTLASFSEHLAELELFPEPPAREVSRLYRTWAYESAALDLALRQAQRTLHAALGREPQPVRYVVSLRLGEPPTLDPITRRLVRYPSLRFKLDPTSDWTDALVTELAALGVVDTLDLKGAYKGTIVDQPADAKLYRLVAEAFPDAWIEDPDLSSEAARDVLEPHRDRVTWDAVIHSVGDIEALPFPPRGMNIKPSRFGSIHALLDAYDYCREHGIVMYGGGQFELGPGRGQIQYLASLFHPDAPNDVAPGVYNEGRPRSAPRSPLPRRRPPRSQPP